MDKLQEPRQGQRPAKVGMVATVCACKAKGAASRRVRMSASSLHPVRTRSHPRFAIVLISNQALRATELENWKKKIPLIANAVCSLSFPSLDESLIPRIRKSCPTCHSACLLHVPRMGIESRCLACGMNSNASLENKTSTSVHHPLCTRLNGY